MTKEDKAESAEQPERTCLYDILGIEKAATELEIKKAYRVRALQCHPDKNPSPEAKLNFQKVVAAYNILKDNDSRKLYDETGYIEGEGFDQAADFFRTKFGRISEEDIVAFAGKYKFSDDERKDVKEYYSKHSGNVAGLLEWIPLSEPGEVERFITMIDELIKDGEIETTPTYKPSLSKLRKSAVKMAKEQAKFANDENSNDTTQLVLAITEKRRQASESFLDDLMSKYAKPKKARKL